MMESRSGGRKWTIYCGEIYRETTAKLERSVKGFVNDGKESNGSQSAEIYAWKWKSGNLKDHKTEERRDVDKLTNWNGRNRCKDDEWKKYDLLRGFWIKRLWVEQNKLRMQDGAALDTNIIWFYKCLIYYSKAGAFARTQLYQEFGKVQTRLRHLERHKFMPALHSCLQILNCHNQFTLILFGECTEMTTEFSQRKTF